MTINELQLFNNKYLYSKVYCITFEPYNNTKTLHTMETLINNAKSQFKMYGQVEITIYPNRDYENSSTSIEKTLEDAIRAISQAYESLNDDIRVPHAYAL